ncbi:MAG: signal recognition particle protein [Desulfobacteraceae bacterium]|jgi:signal recognition particle subunit SRP54|nr:signal recognition particle protein [Desulfobacteraceae bacterium]MDH3572580.1 signal recognition particle protein [Desulfobacteraceae bacterium]MDH3720139.1 signal recognition particle protein [Desulfobacteraceae bacterium]MDH3835706.1 signal recognition particle protein [Desulfobacteraceae bacterium]MDH3873144.1 signal recognition particle protein [Desulfobacteraceae bacterium]
MFDNLSDKLNAVFKKLKGHGKLTEKNIEEGLREVRMALLEADVHFKVVKSFISGIKERSLGQEVMSSLTPGQQVIKIVNDELTKLMGGVLEDLNLSGSVPVSIMLVGLQGSGKTTTAGKLAVFLRKKGRKPYLVPADIYRPAAIDQLTKLGEQLSVPVFPSSTDMDPVQICQEARTTAHRTGCDTLLIDTAGRLHIDETLMDELCRIKDTVKPTDILLVADAMTGQDAVNIAKSFNNTLDIGGVVLTKMDGDARGGAALSIKSITNKPIKFVGVGEKLSDLEPFHPDRMSSRILGMGDVLTIIEKAQSVVDEKKAAELEKKLRKNAFTLEDFRDQMVQVRKMGSMSEIIKMIPGMNKVKQLKNLEVDDKELIKIEAIINSMTPQERRQHTLIKGSRRKRIAKGSGTSVQDINKLLKNYNQVMKMIKNINKGGMRGFGAGMPSF